MIHAICLKIVACILKFIYVMRYKMYCFMLQIAIFSSGFEKRKHFIISLLVLQYATVLEYDVLSYQKVSLHLKYLDFHFILSFELPLNFPKEQFSLTLYSIYHMTNQGIPFFKHIQNIPYSPRWEPKQMIAKALQHVLDAEVPIFQDLQHYNARVDKRF